MGYTHYWDIKKNEKYSSNEMRDSFKKVSNEIQKLIKQPELITNLTAGHEYNERVILIGGSHGYPTPIVNESEIWFNGDESKGLDHETFSITCNHFYDGLWEGKFAFCKTARKPYDIFVCFALISFAQHFPKNVFEYSSDGDHEDWAPAFELYTKVTGKKIRNHKYFKPEIKTV